MGKSTAYNTVSDPVAPMSDEEFAWVDKTMLNLFLECQQSQSMEPIDVLMASEEVAALSPAARRYLDGGIEGMQICQAFLPRTPALVR